MTKHNPDAIPLEENNVDGFTKAIEVNFIEEDLSDEVLERAIAAEISGFGDLIELKVKDQLVVQLYQQGDLTPVVTTKIARLLKSLFKAEYDHRVSASERINDSFIPDAKKRPGRSDNANIYTQIDLPQLDFYYNLQTSVVNQLYLYVLAPDESYEEMAEQYVRDLLPIALEEVQMLPNRTTSDFQETTFQTEDTEAEPIEVHDGNTQFMQTVADKARELQDTNA